MTENNMQSDKKEIWFPAKKYGWGWGIPCAWQGWVVYAVWFAVYLGGSMFVIRHSVGLFVVYSIVLSVALISVVAIKGEKPRWHWGENENRQARSKADRLTELEELRRRQLVSESEYEARRQEILREA